MSATSVDLNGIVQQASDDLHETCVAAQAALAQINTAVASLNAQAAQLSALMSSLQTLIDDIHLHWPL